MALLEFSFPSSNGRDEIQAWGYAPVRQPRGIVQITHGLAEHSRRYLRIITALLDAGFIVVTQDQAGHGATAVKSGVWLDAGEDGAKVLIADEHALHERVSEQFPDLPYIMYGHSLGSMIVRALQLAHPGDADGLILTGPMSQVGGMSAQEISDAIDEAIATSGGSAPDSELLIDVMLESALDRYEDVRTPYDWLSTDPHVVEDHMKDPYCCADPTAITLDYARTLVDIYARSNDRSWAGALRQDVPVLIMAGDMDPVVNFGEGAYAIANMLWQTGHHDVRTRVFPGARHEVQFEQSCRDEARDEIVAWAEHVVDVAAARCAEAGDVPEPLDDEQGVERGRQALHAIHD